MSKNYKILDEFCEKPLIRIGIGVGDLEVSLRFYVEKLGCQVARERRDSVEIDFFGYSVVLHARCGDGSGKDINDTRPAGDSYFGLVVSWADWHQAVSHLTYVGTKFKANPEIVNNDSGEREASFILEDPSRNLLRFVAYED
tara:strand:+ start:790 stop:1215 length:426 start_codon:yes stop_codon:yes gene_type:complete